MSEKNVLIIPNLTKPHTAELLGLIVARLRSCGCLPMMDALYAGKYEAAHFGALDALLAECDVIVTVGGDGTILHSAKSAMACHKPILGINTGRLGYLAQLEPNELEYLDRLASGDYTIQKRMMLEVEIEGLDERYFALNDVVISKGDLGRLVDLDIVGDGRPIGSYRADGLIFATPTGSTAYSLSAGGPIVDPAIETVIVTPICPHSLNDRSILLPPEMRLRVRSRFVNSSDAVVVSVDGERVVGLDRQRTVSLRRSAESVGFISFSGKTFNDILSKKLKSRG